MEKKMILFWMLFSGIYLVNTAFVPVSNDNSSPQAPDTTTYYVDVQKSKIEWFCEKHTGYVLFKSGYLKLKDDEIVGGDLTVLMDSIVNCDIDYELMRLTLQNVLRSKEFFNVEEFPVSTFHITSIRKMEGNKYCISGNMKLMQVSRSVSFHCDLNTDNEVLKATSDKFIVDRTEWGITSMSKDHVKSDDSFIVTDEIILKIHLVAVAR